MACNGSLHPYNSNHVAAQQSEQKEQRPDSAGFQAGFN
jgi:hypothetical protein